LPASNPSVVGAKVRVYNQAGESAWLDLPASGWSTYQSGTRTQLVFKNREAPLGSSTVKLAMLREQQLIRVAARSSGLTLDEASQGTVGIQLIIGSDVYCSECTAPTRDTPGRYKAHLCPAPASCPAYCGNGVVDQSSEQCDSPDPGMCVIIQGLDVACEPPGAPNECGCCGVDTCFFGLFGTLPCCGDSQCQDITGVGQARTGACIPPSCTQDADCNGYRCENGECCGNAGQLCGVAGCCSDSGSECTSLQSIFNNLCCRAPGASCESFIECCSLSCTAGICDP
jgi:hypothetical protein